MLVRNLACLLLAAAPAEACPPSVRLAGDPGLVAEVASVLEKRGILTAGAGGACAPVMVRVERRDGAIGVTIATAEAIEREVREVETAATVIESFTRDLATPLLAAQPVALASATVAAVPPTANAPPAVTRPRGPQLFAGLESTVGSDRSSWLGFHGGGCKMVGVVCLAGRVRTSSVVAIGDPAIRRQSYELLFGIDVPFAVGRWLILPGFGGGPSGTRTTGATETHRSTGVRAEAHATLSIPVSSRFAIDLHVALNLLQPLRVHDREMQIDGELVPDEPWGYARAGFALRYGAR